MRAPFGETRIRYRYRKTAHNQAARRTFAYLPHRAEAHTTVLSKSVGRAFALS